MKTFSAAEGDIQRRWLLVDAEGKTSPARDAGRDGAARKLKPIYTPHMDTGDFVIVINADKIKLTGTKPEKKKYFHHTMYPGGATWTKISRCSRSTRSAYREGVKGMVPRNRLGRAMVKKLKVYAGPQHPHQAQMPEAWTIEA
jgi:large subunit ribosomal protein L13